ncbi:MAG: DUF333 domain-containing protein [Patescibacteria group bacterium]
MDKKNILIIVLIVILLSSLSINVFQYTRDRNINTVSDSNMLGKNKNTQIANPASTNCKDVGGVLEIRKNKAGAEYGLCMFEENRACEEWALFRGDCPVGGRKITGFDTDAQKYCAYLGGDTLAEENAKCTFKDGSICDDEKLFNGECSKGDSLK